MLLTPVCVDVAVYTFTYHSLPRVVARYTIVRGQLVWRPLDPQQDCEDNLSSPSNI